MKNRLKEARFFARKPQIQLWIETGIYYSTISRIEVGYLEPTESQKEKLARALGVDKEWLFPEGDDDEIKNRIDQCKRTAMAPPNLKERKKRLGLSKIEDDPKK